MIRIAFGQTDAQDWPETSRAMVSGGPLDYLLLRCGREGAALIASLADALRERGIRVLASIDGCSPRRLAETLHQSVRGLSIAVVSGGVLDQESARLAELGVALPESLVSIRARLSAFALDDGLSTGADVVIAGSCAAESLALAPAVHRFGWREEDSSLLAGASLAGHVLAAGATACGGSTQVDWQTLQNPAALDAPIAELDATGSCVITKHPGSGGAVSRHTVLEALLHGIGDPRAWHTPDCLIDLTSAEVTECGPDRVRLSGAAATAPPAALAEVRWQSGWRAAGEIIYTWPAALEKAYAADRILRGKAASLGLRLDEIRTDFAGAGASHVPAAVLDASVPEVVLRIAARGCCKADVERFSRLIDPAVGWGPPGGFSPPGTGEARVEELTGTKIISVPREFIRPRVEAIA